ncbi:uncharacterized protein LOC127529438 [Erpetoichthys calabaricus]|uniref:uncharacterized protein LOC127529438 n=1 Tax=Erpetoichthys calabaricus TaxID=27687 RepID=UPI0022344616|nr:uncharacterized protein LOC127529438 [Erpetoichthys calabaricus]
MLRLYLCSKKTDIDELLALVISSDTDSDFVPDGSTQIKLRKASVMKRKPKLIKQSYVRVDEKIDGHSHRNMSSVPEMDESQHKEHSVVITVKRKSERKMKWTDNKVHENYDGSGHGRISSDTDHVECPHEQLSRFVSSSPIDNSEKLEIALAIDTSLEDPEIQFGNMYDNSESALMSTLSWHFPDQEFIMNDQQLPVASTDEPARDESVKEVQKIKIRCVNIIQDMMYVFKEPKVLDVILRIEFVCEKAIGDHGVSREAYIAFWEEFMEQCEGEEERVPRLRPDYSEKEWQAVGRIWSKGYVDHGIIPVRLSQAFVFACIQGIDAVDESLLMSSFLKYLSSAEQECIEKALQGNMDEINKEDLIDLLTRMGSHNLPPQDNMQSAILTMAHKDLLQEPKFIIDCFISVRAVMH